METLINSLLAFGVWGEALIPYFRLAPNLKNLFIQCFLIFLL